MERDHYRLLGELQTLDFVLSELSFHLSRHPEDAHALRRRQEFHRLRKELVRQNGGGLFHRPPEPERDLP